MAGKIAILLAPVARQATEFEELKKAVEDVQVAPW